MEFACGLCSGAVVVEVVGGVAAEDGGVASFVGEILEEGEEFGFAVIAAAGVVGGEAGVVHFAGVDDFEGGADFFGELGGAAELVLLEELADGEAGEDVFGTEAVEGDLEEEGAVDAAGVGDEDAAVVVEEVAKVLAAVVAVGGVGRCGRVVVAMGVLGMSVHDVSSDDEDGFVG